MVVSVAPSRQATVWRVDPKHTQVEFAVSHLSISTIKGRFRGVRGRIVDVPESRAEATVEIEIDTASLESGEEERDEHVRSPLFLDAAVYPTMTFRSTRVEPQGGNRLLVAGDLTLHGVTHEVVLDATANGHAVHPITQEHVFGLSATTRLSRSQSGIELPVPFAGSTFVGDDIHISINVEATRTEDSSG